MELCDFCAAILMLSMGVGEYISAKTKGIFGSILVLSLIYLIGYQAGIIPDTTPVDTGIIAIAGNFGTLMIITNLGTMINLKQLINEYRAVVIAVVALVLGVIFNELGFLDDNALQKAGYFNLCMLGLIAAILPSFAVLSISDIMSLIVPIVFFLLLGVICLGLGGGLVGKFVFKYDFRLSAALGMCAMIGFPFTMILSNDVVNGMKLPEEQAQRMTDVILPKMVISGFVSVTVCSVIIASLVVPYI